jgi:hypothetical protein
MKRTHGDDGNMSEVGKALGPTMNVLLAALDGVIDKAEELGADPYHVLVDVDMAITLQWTRRLAADRANKRRRKARDSAVPHYKDGLCNDSRRGCSGCDGV